MHTPPRFATYLHPETLATTRPPEDIPFVGKSWPHAAHVRQGLVARAGCYPTLPLRTAAFEAFAMMHSATYLGQLQQMAAGVTLDVPPRLSAECSGLKYCLPGYMAGLGGMLEAIDQMRAGTLDRPAEVHCPVLSVHGGGYQPSVNVSAAMHHIETLASYRPGVR